MSNSHEKSPPTESEISKGALISGVINAVINGVIQYFLLSGHERIPLTVDGITNETKTVFGSAVPLAVSLAMILTWVAYLNVKSSKPKFFPGFLWMTVKHGFFALGVVITFAVLWQRIFGSIQVPVMAAVMILGLVAGAVSAIVNYMTIRAAVAPRA